MSGAYSICKFIGQVRGVAGHVIVHDHVTAAGHVTTDGDNVTITS